MEMAFDFRLAPYRILAPNECIHTVRNRNTLRLVGANIERRMHNVGQIEHLRSNQ